MIRNDLGYSRRSAIAGGLALAIVPRAAMAAASFDTFVTDQMQAATIPGLAVGIARKGVVTFAKGYGLADIATRRPVGADTMFHIASITKTVTGSAIMQLVDSGLIALDDPVAPHLDFPIAGEGAERITFRHLLQHTSGISDDVYYEVDFRVRGKDSTLGLGEMVRGYLAPGGRYTGAGNVKSLPGARWSYSNMGFALLGYLFQRVCGQDLRIFTAEKMFRPLGLKRIAWALANTPEYLRATPYDVADGAPVAVEPAGFPDYSVGMIRASVGDLTQIVAAAANHGVSGRTRLLSAQANAQMLEMTKPADLPDWLTGQGLAWQEGALGGIPRPNHWGGDPGVLTMAYLDPATRTAVVLLSNLSATRESRDAMKAIAAKAFDHPA
ncbi:serine hydrolase domain-containing protein [Novosphingobium sp. BL-8H]|uniref:serine hydrolase domain-containing protein n=1 Tax=Novosphingobium sp. BL-8H TaxID=3127640 RepID=UPI003757204E